MTQELLLQPPPSPPTPIPPPPSAPNQDGKLDYHSILSDILLIHWYPFKPAQNERDNVDQSFLLRGQKI